MLAWGQDRSVWEIDPHKSAGDEIECECDRREPHLCTHPASQLVSGGNESELVALSGWKRNWKMPHHSFYDS